MRKEKAIAVTDKDSDQADSSRPLTVSILISAGALAIALLHVLLPTVEIDAITIALLILALLPWIGPIFKSIELPGGIKLELREEMRQLKSEVSEKLEIEEKKRSEIDERIRQIEIAFRGQDIGQAQKSEIESALKAFDAYLRSLGADYGDFPAVNVVTDRPSLYIAHYEPDKNEIVVVESALADRDGLYREYCYRAFQEPLDDELRDRIVPPVEEPYYGLAGIISGFGFYLACSFQNEAASSLLISLNSRSEVWGSSPRDGGQMHMQSLGERWARFLWSLRESFGADALDRSLISAWNEVEIVPDPNHLSQRFLTNLSGQLETGDLVEKARADWDLELD